MIHLSRGLRALLLGATCATLLAACGGDDNLDDRTGLADPKARFVHAIPGGPAVTLQRNGSNDASATNVDYKFADQYASIDTSFTNFTLRQASNSAQLAIAGFDPARGHKYTLVALPTASGAELMVIDDPYNKALTNDDTRLRVLHAAANAQPVDVYVTGTATDLAAAAPGFVGVSHKQVAPASGSDSREVEDGTYRIRLTPQGSKTVIFDTTVAVPNNGDWLLVVLPANAAQPVTNAVQVMLVRADDSADATDDLPNQP